MLEDVQRCDLLRGDAPGIGPVSVERCVDEMAHELEKRGNRGARVCEELEEGPAREVGVLEDLRVLVGERGELCEVEQRATVAGQQRGREQVVTRLQSLLLVEEERGGEVAEEEETRVVVAGVAERGGEGGERGEEGSELERELLLLGGREGREETSMRRRESEREERATSSASDCA